MLSQSEATASAVDRRPRKSPFHPSVAGQIHHHGSFRHTPLFLPPVVGQAPSKGDFSEETNTWIFLFDRKIDPSESIPSVVSVFYWSVLVLYFFLLSSFFFPLSSFLFSLFLSYLSQ